LIFRVVKELRDEMQAASKKLDEEKEGHKKTEGKLEEALGRERALQEAQQVHAKELEEALGRERALQEAQQVHAKELEDLKTALRQQSATSALLEDDMLEKERTRLELREAHAALEEAYTEIDQAKNAQTAAEKAASSAALKVSTIPS
jgi:chromosome segregation ATPase